MFMDLGTCFLKMLHTVWILKYIVKITKYRVTYMHCAHINNEIRKWCLRLWNRLGLLYYISFNGENLWPKCINRNCYKTKKVLKLSHHFQRLLVVNLLYNNVSSSHQVATKQFNTLHRIGQVNLRNNVYG